MKLSPVEQRRLARMHRDGGTAAAPGIEAPRLTECDVRGRPTMVASFPATATAPAHQIAMEFLNDFPNLRTPFAHALFKHLTVPSRKSPATRKRISGELAAGIFSFLAEAGEFQIVMTELADIGSRFVWWLNRSGFKGAISYKRNLLGSVEQVLTTAARHAAETGLSEPPQDWPRNCWKGRADTQPPQERFLKPERMSGILRRCRVLVEETMRVTTPLLDAFEGGRRENRVVAAALDVTQLLQKLFDQDRGANPNPPVHALSERLKHPVRQLILPSRADLMPFVVLLAHYTRWNPQTLMDLRIDGIRRVRFMGIDRIILTSVKTRPTSKQETVAFGVDDRSTNPSILIAFLERWLGVMRRLLKSDLLFVAKGASRLLEVGPQIRVSKLDLSDSIKACFRGEFGVFSVPEIRKGMIDLTHLLTDGDPNTTRASGNHSFDVSLEHYKSPEGGRRDAERLAAAMAENERWLGSGGRIDVRKLPEKADRSAATPGFTCLSNRSSPMPGEVHGRPCSSYGRCPICPLAAVDPSSPRSCAYLHLLLDRIECSFDTDDAMNAGAFIGVWAPIAAMLRDHWLPSFSEDVRRAAARLDLPNLPELT